MFMKSDVIHIDNQGVGYTDALRAVEKTAQYRELSGKESLQLQLCAEELLSLARSVTGELQAAFWLESEGKQFDLHLSTSTLMDRGKRDLLISSATSRKNEAAKTFLGMLRDKFEEAMTAEPDYSENSIPENLIYDVLVHPEEEPEWDGFEKSVLRKVADRVTIAIRGGKVDMTVSKRFA